MPNSDDFNRFAYNPVDLNMNRTLFNMDHSVKFSGNVGDVIPFECTEIYPGDTVSIDTTKVIRLQPLVAPIMDEVICDVYYFFCPHRLVWNHWQQFLGENTESKWTPAVEYNIPKLKAPEHGFAVGSVADYLGIPPLSEDIVKQLDDDPNASTFLADDGINALPFRGYALICDQWFRSEAYMDPVHVYVDDETRVGSVGSDQVTDVELGGMPFVACKFPDYFTSMLPSPQRGEPVELPLFKSTSQVYVPVIGLPSQHSQYGTHPYSTGNIANSSASLSMTYTTGSGVSSLSPFSGTPHTLGESSGKVSTVNDTVELYNNNIYFDNLWSQIKGTDLGVIGNAVTINDLRTAFAVQKYLEKQARFGGRYIEFIKGFFGIDSPDARLQRTEYLGGSRISLNINSVEQTSATTDTSTPLGNVAGMSVTADSNSDFTKSFTEHGYLFGLCVLRYHHSYTNGVDRHFLNNSKFDYYVPTFANLGEMKVQRAELDVFSAFPYSALGYQEAWSWLRFKNNRIAGEMRVGVPNSLSMWHLGDYFTSTDMNVTASFMREDKSNLDRCLAVTSDVANQAIFDFYLKMEMSRILPMYSIPGFIDHN